MRVIQTKNKTPIEFNFCINLNGFVISKDEIVTSQTVNKRMRERERKKRARILWNSSPSNLPRLTWLMRSKAISLFGSNQMPNALEFVVCILCLLSSPSSSSFIRSRISANSFAKELCILNMCSICILTAYNLQQCKMPRQLLLLRVVDDEACCSCKSLKPNWFSIYYLAFNFPQMKEQICYCQKCTETIGLRCCRKIQRYMGKIVGTTTTT